MIHELERKFYMSNLRCSAVLSLYVWCNQDTHVSGDDVGTTHVLLAPSQFQNYIS